MRPVGPEASASERETEREAPRLNVQPSEMKAESHERRRKTEGGGETPASGKTQEQRAIMENERGRQRERVLLFDPFLTIHYTDKYTSPAVWKTAGESGKYEARLP